LQWEESPDPEGSEPALRRPHLPSPRRIPVSPLPPAENKNKRRRARKWCLLEEETLRKGVELYVILSCCLKIFSFIVIYTVV
jgi:telomeric repeat-binding factor 2